MTQKANADLRKAFVRAGLFHWQVARKIGISEPQLTRWLREELTPDDPRRQRILAALEGGTVNGTEQRT